MDSERPDDSHAVNDDSDGSEERREAISSAAGVWMNSQLPDISEALRKSGAAQNLGSPFTSAIGRFSSEVLKSLDFPKIEMPMFKVDTSTLFPNVGKLTDQISKMLEPAMTTWVDSYREQFAGIAANLKKIVRSSFPPNWRGEELVDLPENLETLLLDEGLPLAWVPPRPVLVKLFAAESAGARRTVISNNWRGIVAACRTELEGINEPKLREYVEFAVEAAESLQDGRWRASQALSANLMDSILHRSFGKASKKKLTSQKTRIDWKNYPIRPALVLGGIWGSYSEYRPGNGDQIPRKYTRHATAHGVSRRQYTRLNSVIALMHVVGLLKVIESDFFESE